MHAESPVSSESATFTYEVTYLNRAPITNSMVNTSSLTPVEEDIPIDDNEGDQVGYLAQGVASDADDAYLGLAVTDANTSYGDWEYRESDGAWTLFPRVLSPYSALLLPNDTFVRFTPRPDFFGESSFLALAWDMSNDNSVISNGTTTSFNTFTGPFSVNDVSFNIEVFPVNDPPLVELEVTTVTFTESNPPISVQIFQGNLTIFDVDDSTFVSATVILECPDCSGSTEPGSGRVSSGMSLTPDSNDMILIQHPPMGFSPNLVQANQTIELRIEYSQGAEVSMEMLVDYLQSLHFANVDNEPMDADRVVTLYVDDGSDTSYNITVTISINLVNDEIPVVTLPELEATFGEDQGPVLVFTSEPVISDLDDNSQFPLYGATLYLLDADLTFEELQLDCSATSLNCSYSNSTGILSIEGVAYVSEYEQVLGQVVYSNVRDEPDNADRAVRLTVFDGVFNSVPVSLPIHIQLINDQLPILTLLNETIELQEGQPQLQVVRIVPSPARIMVFDADNVYGEFPVDSVEVSLLNPRDPNEGLRVANSGHNFTVSMENGNSTLFITDEGGLSLEGVVNALLLVEYFNFAEQPSGANRTIRIRIFDNLTLEGVRTNEPVDITIVFLQDDDPPFVMLMNEVVTYSEGQEPRQVLVSPSAVVGDLDNSEISGLQIELVPSDPSIDVSREVLNITQVEPGITLNRSSQMLYLSGTASVNAYTTTLRTLTYEHTEIFGDPDSGPRVILVTPFDLSQSLGMFDEVTVAFTAVPNPPILDLNGVQPGRNYETVFTEESISPVSLVSEDFVLLDVDSDDLSFVEITLSQYLDEEEYITVNSTLVDTLGIALVSSSSSFIRLEGQPTALVEYFRTILLTLEYFNGADEPVDTPRVISVVASDGTANGTGQASSTVDILLMNDPPFISINTGQESFNTQYSENGNPVYIAPMPQIQDPDSLLMMSVTIRPQTSRPGDVITGLPNPNEYQLVFDDPTPVSEVESLIGNLTFHSFSSEPPAGDRIYCISVMDTDSAESNEVCTTITVVAVNDNSPTFNMPLYSADVIENAAGVTVVQVTAMDADETNSNVTLTYTIVSGDDCHNSFSGASSDFIQPECTFSIDNETGVITTSIESPPDREARDSYTLAVVVSDGFFENMTFVEVTIRDENDNVPCFDPTTYTATIPPGELPGYVIANLSVQDPDLNEQLGLIPTPVSGPSSMNAFILDENNVGVVVLGIPEGSIVPGTYIIEYEASDISGKLSKNPATLEITVIANMETPQFDLPSYTASPVSESAPIGTFVITVGATDGDQGSHGDLNYSLNTTAPLPFTINETTGEITVSNSLDFEEQEQYTFTVIAYDNGRPEAFFNTALVTVQLINVNEHVPIFTEPSYFASFCEGALAGTVLVTVVANDQDSGQFGEVVYTILPMSLDCGDCVNLNATTGEVVAAATLDFEQYESINLTVLAMDAAGQGFEFAPVQISILNDNEFSPQFPFETLSITIPENYPVGAPLPNISAYDPLATDSDACDVDQCNGQVIITNDTCSHLSALAYSIPAGNEDGLFCIDSTSGLLSLNTSLDFDLLNHQLFSLTISVTDGQLSDTAVVSIAITDVNEHLPIFESPSYNATVLENVVTGTEILQVTATDQDRTATISYSMTGQNSEHFEIDSATGRITTAQALDFEDVPEYRLMLLATDLGATGNSSMAILDILLIDINDNAPTFTEVVDPVSFSENNFLGMEIALLVATDPDFASTIQFSVVHVMPGGIDLFGILQNDAFSAYLTANASFDYEEDAIEYAVVVEAQDSGNPPLSSNITIMVQVEDSNDNGPQFSEAEYNVSVSENTNVGEAILQLIASDRDSGENGRLGFTIVDGNELGTFGLNSSTGVLSLTETLDYEAVTLYTLQVAASDFGTFPMISLVTVLVTVVDENDSPPVFVMETYSASILEGSAEGTFVVQVTATDADMSTNAEIRYGFEASLIGNPFSLDSETGTILVGNSNLLDRETTQSFQFTVIAFNLNDAEGENGTTSVTVTLLDINDNSPQFVQDTFVAEVEEDFTPGLGSEGIQSPPDLGDLGGSGSGIMYSTVIRVVAEDLDDPTLPNSQFIFEIIGGSGQTLFDINVQSGDIFATAILDREVEDSYQLVIQATDFGTPSRSGVAYVNITVTDVNDNAPQFMNEPYSAEVFENQPAETKVLQVSALDLDTGSNTQVVYTIPSGVSVPFYIDSASGWITTTQALDRELDPSWSFTVEASDSAVPAFTTSTTISITVLDENDNQPMISPSELTTTVLENSEFGTVIQVFDITDRDVGVNAEFNVSLVGQPSAFAINSSGALTVSGLVDYEAETAYRFSVDVRNVAPPHHTVSANVTIQLENENDNPPIITLGVDQVPYFEKQGRLSLAVGITIEDADGRDVTRLLDGLVEFMDLSTLEPSFPFEPTTLGEYIPYNDYSCSLEDKVQKVESCGIEDPVFVTESSLVGSNRLVTVNLDPEDIMDNTLIFDASKQQHAFHNGEGLDASNQMGLTISTWIWVEPSSSRSTVLAKVGFSNLLYGIFCTADSSLEFQYFAGTEASLHSVFFTGVCTQLQSAWHHLAVVVDNMNQSQWRVHVYVDSEYVETQDISPFTDNNGRLYMGAYPETLTGGSVRDYFTGRLHLLVISNSIAHRNTIVCLTGCGVAFVSSIAHETPLTHYYNFTSRTLMILGRHEISVYEQFLDSLIMVIPFIEPRVSGYRISYTVQDELFNCLPTFIFIPIIPQNDFTPELSLNGDTSVDFSTVFVEENGPVAVVNRSSFFLTEMEFIEFPYVVSVQILDPLQPEQEEILEVSNVPPEMNVTYQQYTLIMTGNLPLTMFEDVLRTLTYNNIADEPLGESRRLLITVSDSPMPDVTANVNITLIYVNDPPELDVVSTMTEYREEDGVVPILESVSITDSDNTTLVSASVSFSAPDGDMEILSANTAGSNIQAVYDSSTGTLSLEGEDTLDNYTSVLQSLSYIHHSSTDPIEETRIFNISVFDGVDYSERMQAMLFFEAVNDIPVLDLNGPGPGFNFEIDFIEDTDTIIPAISLEATLTDVDSTSLIFLNISLSPTPDGTLEMLLISVPSGTGVDTTFNDTNLELLPRPGTRIVDFLNVLSTLQYQNLAEEPTEGLRTVEFIASDGVGLSMPVFTTVRVMTVNDPPVLDLDPMQLGYQATYTEGGPSVRIASSAVTISDNDREAAITTVSIVIHSVPDGFGEMIQSSNPNFTVPEPGATNGTLTYTFIPGNGSLTYVAELLASLTYRNVRDEPTPGDRLVQIAVSDGIAFSNSELVTVTVQTVNDNVPTFSQSTYTGNVFENQPPGTSAARVIAMDIDSGPEGEVSYNITSVTPSEGLSYFEVQPSGEILTTTQLDREEFDLYTLSVIALDAGSPPQSSTSVIVSISIHDVNDITPMFTDDTQFELSVSESREIGYTVETVSATDSDRGFNAITEFIIGGIGSDSPFGVEQNGNIVVQQELDSDAGNTVYNISVIVQDLGFPALSSEAVFTITILDENDNHPQFTQSEYEVSIPENQAVPFPVLAVSASDADSTPVNSNIMYDFVDPTIGILFAINRTTGTIASLIQFDRESQSSYIFEVEASDGTLTNITTVRVSVTDENDNMPIFSQSLYEGRVSENVFPGTLVMQLPGMANTSAVTFLQVMATDQDEGENGEFRFSIQPTGQVTPMFSLELAINVSTGGISVGEPGDFEIQQEANFTVIATDQGVPARTGTATLRVYILDENDNAPMFDQTVYQTRVPENEVGYSVARVTAIDLDSFENGGITYTLMNELDSFEIDPESGNITTRVGLDFETDCFFRLMVLAEDLGQPPRNSPAIVEVSVEPLQDIDPIFENGTTYIRSVCENLPAGTSVLQVTAFDGDLITCAEAEQQSGSETFSGSGAVDLLVPEYSPIVYSLVSHEDLFAVDDSSGLITTRVELDREINPQYLLTVLATDLGGSIVEANVTVNVIDKNDNLPYFLQDSYFASVSENTAVGTSVLQVLARDPDMLDEGRLSYSLLQNPDFFGINSQTGVISVSDVIDFELVNQTLTFFAQVNDTSSQFYIANVSIMISDENDLPPTIETLPQTLIFTEGQVSLRPFPEIEITDPDSFQRLCSASIQLTSPQVENSELVTLCSCSNVTDETTCLPGCFEFLQVPDGTFPGEVTQSSDGFSLTLQGNFSIEIYETAIQAIEYVNVIFNPIPEDRHVTLYVFDCQLQSNMLIQPIEIRLLNVFPPVLNLSVDGTAPPGIDFETTFTERGEPIPIVSNSVSITDEDTTREVQELTSLDIWITNPVDGNLESVFLPVDSTLPQNIECVVDSLHNITLTGAASLADYEASLFLVRYVNTAEEPTPTQRIINLQAHEYFLFSEVASVAINFETINDHPPVIFTEPPDRDNSRITHTEGTGGLRITAPDAFIKDDDSTNDPVIELSVSLLSSQSQYDYIYFDAGPIGENLLFSIDFERLSNVSLVFTGEAASTDYDIILRNLFYQYTGDEFESLSSRYILLQAADLAFSSFSVVQVDLEPVNDQMPVFLESFYSAGISESASIGENIEQVEAIDNDRFSEADIVYSIASGNEDGLFAILPSNGTVYVSQTLDFETSSIHRLIVEARDQNYAGPAGVLPGTTVVTIIVGDINEHVPMFNQTMHNISIAEGVPIGTRVLQLFASDQDGELHSQLEFEILDNDEDFVIGRETGIILTNTDIDREVTPFYQFGVKVNNPGNTAFDVAIVSINVLDLDDNPPELVLTPISVTLQEPETTVTLSNMLQISDVDPNPPSLDFAIVQILPETNPAPGYLFSLVQSGVITVSGNGTGKLIFTGLSRSLSEYETILRGVVYVDLADEPNFSQRVIAYQVGSDVADPGTLDFTPSDTVSNVSEFIVNIQLINDQAPRILLDARDLSAQNLTLPGCDTPGSFSTVFTEDGPPSLLSDSSLTVTDPDSGESLIYSAVVAVLDIQDPGMEYLAFEVGDTLSVGGGTTAERIILEGPATAEEFANVLRSVR